MNTTEVAIKMVLDRWDGSIKNWNAILNQLSDETLQKEIAPGKNRGIYLLGHLIAVHDDMIRLLDFGDRMHPELHEPFLTLADKAVNDIPSAAELRTIWNEQNALLTEKFAKLQPGEWFEKHTAVTTEDFANEPYRNKLNIIVTRTSHLQYHSGQLVLLK